MPRFHILRLSQLHKIYLFIFLSATSAWAKDTASIFDMRKSLPMDAKETVYHDFYINSGSEVGLKRGVFVNIVRSIPIHDPIQNKAQATLNVAVAKIKIIQVERNMSVGRLVSLVSPEDRPALDFDAVMIGDQIDLNSISSEGARGGKRKAQDDTEEDANDQATTEASSSTQSTVTVPLRAVATESVVLQAQDAKKETVTEKTGAATPPAGMVAPIQK